MMRSSKLARSVLTRTLRKPSVSVRTLRGCQVTNRAFNNYQGGSSGSNWDKFRYGSAFGSGGAGVLLGAGWFQKKKKTEKKPDRKNVNANTVIPLSEVKKHCTADSLWVTFRGDVYDITPFLTGHPGLKSRLLMAGGNDLSVFWRIYNDHYRGHVIPWMQRFKIGKLTAQDRKEQESSFEFWNAYDDDPVRHPDLLPCTYHPFNGECLLERLTEQYYTPNHLHYVRNHLPVPRIESDDYELIVNAGNGIKINKTYTLKDLKTKFKKYEVVSPLQCAGNRREDFHGVPRRNPKAQPDEPDVNLIYIGPHWVVGAFSCAKWGGCRLRDVLADCGLNSDQLSLGNMDFGDGTSIGAHIHFTGYDCDETGLEYGVSIPLDKAIDGLGDCLVAYEMNGKPLPRDHGYPCRALVPGFAGARNCKWLHEISLEPKASMKPWHENAYRGFSPDISFEEDLFQWESSDKVHLRQKTKNDWQPPIGEIALEQPIQSVVCNPPPNATVGAKGGLESIEVKGVAWSGGGRNVHRVDVSIDGGKSFVGAELLKPRDLREKETRMHQWGWYHFRANVPIPSDIQDQIKKGGKYELEVCSKAVSGDFNVQPATIEEVYNARGIQVNHYYRVPVHLDGKVRKNELIRKDLKDKFRNKPSGGKFRIPWEPDNGDMEVNFVKNKSEINAKWDQNTYDYAHAK